jgi:signal transduction histidine kinase
VAPVSSPHRAPVRGRHDRLVDVGLAVAVLAVSIALLVAGDAGVADDGVGGAALVVVLVALTSLPLVARRRAPLTVFVVMALATAALRLVAEPAGPPVGPTVALFSLAAAAGGPRVRPRVAMAIAAAMGLLHLAANGVANGGFPGAELGFAVVLWSGVWVAGDRARLRAERIGELEERAARAEREAERDRRLAAAEERLRIARDLHDSAGHAINVILVHAGLGRMRVGRDPDGARAAFETIEEVARETVGEIDQLVGVLREGSEPDGDRLDGIEPPGVAALDGLVARHRAAGMDVTTAIRGDRRPLAPGLDQGVYRIVQEALTNAARHGTGTAQVDVDFSAGALELTVANPVARNGHAPTVAGHGVIGMRERAALLGGTLEADVDDGRFSVRARLPLPGRRP